MKNISKLILTTMIISIIHLLTSCNDFLDEKPTKDLVVPQTLADLQALLDNATWMNTTPAAGVLGSDEFYVTDAGYNLFRSQIAKNAYTWEGNIFEGASDFGEWSVPFRAIFYANIVLEEVAKNTEPNEDLRNQIKGAALFYRAYANAFLLELFAPPFLNDQDADKLGIPLKKNSRLQEPLKRASLKDSYKWVFADLEIAYGLLPEEAEYPTRPTKIAVNALRARIYLNRGDYGRALEFSNRVLEHKSDLMDYNELSNQSYFSFPKFNQEVIFHSTNLSYVYIAMPTTVVDPALYASYQDGDLRKELFFRIRAGNVNFFGNYTGTLYQFSGLAVDEVYLIKAECEARAGNDLQALDTLNTLLLTRWKSGNFSLFDDSYDGDVLALVLEERKKELVFRHRRWSDLRRLNEDPKFAKILTREVNGETFSLSPGDPRYVLSIPQIEIDFHQFDQNLR
ncbi:RagB/SusD family nutrient uptake outer membrane protein [Echinicola shivajiensis]|uniref:RagB/SusD family nutrient uptake outer membrane protein n=1 Tax=Echinicola shivajiensis TaxID=1035916 RepID=UPI001BFC31E2|nr:RagB/SusD family nutrient uptake outer membrane protein [Echinicola shivajiensis]